jgi:hypothetical protein
MAHTTQISWAPSEPDPYPIPYSPTIYACKTPATPTYIFLGFLFLSLPLLAFLLPRIAMAVKPSRSAKKSLYDKKLCSLLSQYTQILIVHADNVGSNQLQNIRKGLRGDSLVLMGKNTMMKRSIKIHADSTGNEAVRNLIPLLVV